MSEVTTTAAQWRAIKKTAGVLGRRMAYVDEGSGTPVLFLHGNPTSSFLWRNVVPPVRDAGHRVVVPDLIGMGDSESLPGEGPGRYTFAVHAGFVQAFIEAVLPGERIHLVIHDWGSALGFDWARRHPDRVAGIVYMEAIVRPVTWADWPEAARGVFQGFRSARGDELVLERNMFVERVLPASIQRRLADDEMDEYRRPYREAGESRRPVLDWPNQIPIEGEPADVTEVVDAYAAWLTTAPVPKLFVNAEPGSILVGTQRDFCRTWPHQEEVTVPGIHFVQEDSGPQIGRAIADWLGRQK